MSKIIILTGERFGRLLVVSRSSNLGRQTAWNCLCDCGKAAVVRSRSLTHAVTRSCGCISIEISTARLTTHGAAGGTLTPEYSVWRSMKTRCLNPKNKNYPLYGGAGICIDPVWIADFSAFLAHMGPRPSRRHSIDRINGTEGYFPGNCRWATPTVQGRNRRGVKLNETIAAEIRRDKVSGVRRKITCERLGIPFYAYKSVASGRTWKVAQ